MIMESKTHDLIRQLQSLASEAEKQAIDERECTAAIHIGRALSNLNEAMRQTTNSYLARSRSTNTRRRVLPVIDLGISPTNSRRRIFLYGATCSATKPITSSAVTSPLRTTNALGTLPASSSGLGITAASAIPGWFKSSLSNSAGATWYPLYLISSLTRSRM